MAPEKPFGNLTASHAGHDHGGQEDVNDAVVLRRLLERVVAVHGLVFHDQDGFAAGGREGFAPERREPCTSQRHRRQVDLEGRTDTGLAVDPGG
jgi:hypothetical protein